MYSRKMSKQISDKKNDVIKDIFLEMTIGYYCFHSKGDNLNVVFVFNVPPTAKVIWKRGHSLKSHSTDW